MASKNPVIAVVGATGAQGSGLVRAILQDPEHRFTARAITRKPDSEKGRALAAQGVEVVAGDADDAASLERAFRGAAGAFCVTNFWEHFSPDREVAQARAMARAAAQSDVKHVIWSTLEDTRAFVPVSDTRMPTLMGRYKVPHFDGKGEADAVFAEEKAPTTLLRTSFYWDNLISFGAGPKKDASGQLVFALPMGDKKLPGIAAEDIGPCAYGIFKRGPEMVGRTVGIAGEHLTGTRDGGRALDCARSAGSLPVHVLRGVPEARVPRRRGPGQHVPVQARLRARVLRRSARSSRRGRSTPGCRPFVSGSRATRSRFL